MVLGITLGMLLSIGVAAALKSAKPMEVLELAGVVLLLYGIIFFNIWRTRIMIGDHSISFQPAWGSLREVQFKDIARSVAVVLTEPQHPLALQIYGSDQQCPILSLRLKPYRREDVSWLLQLPALKVMRD